MCFKVYKAFSHVIISLGSLYNMEINTLNLQLEKLRTKGFLKATSDMVESGQEPRSSMCKAGDISTCLKLSR